MKRWALVLAAAAAAFGSFGCGVVGQVCTEIFVYGVTLRVTDEAGRPITNAVAVLQDGTYIETMEPFAGGNTGEYVGAGEREGTYNLAITAPGYVPQLITDIDVESDAIGCHVVPVVIEAELEEIF